jgi:adenylosuccinate synthase
MTYAQKESLVDVILGLQWGDEGKGKIVDVLTPNYDIIARFQGGPNAGHTLEFNGFKHVLHTIPSGIFHRDKINLIGNGVLIDPSIFQKEIDCIRAKGYDPVFNLKISRRAHLILPTHRYMDAALEASKGAYKVGSTLKGIGPAYTDKVARTGLRVGDILLPEFNDLYQKLKGQHFNIIQSLGFNIDEFKPEGCTFDEYEARWLDSLNLLKTFELINSEYYLNEALSQGRKVLAEGAQGTLLDIDFGSYPFVTSSNTITSGVCSGLGIPPSKVGKVYGIFKAYCTRVGSGPFPTELLDETGEKLRVEGREFGSTTGRPRRCGWLDMPALRYSVMINGVTNLIMTKTDVLNSFETIKVCMSYNSSDGNTNEFPYEIVSGNFLPVYTDFNGWNCNLDKVSSYNDMPQALVDYIRFIELKSGVGINIVSVGPDRSQIIVRD